MVPIVHALTPVLAPSWLVTADAKYHSEANCRARFTLRGRATVDRSWQLFWLVRHIEKRAHHGYAA